MASMNQRDVTTHHPDPFAFLAGGGAMGELIRSMDWSTTPLGPIHSWPQSLRTTVNICLASDLPICVIWGPGLVQIYNDGYRVICGEKHPRSMGQNFPDCWKEAWPVIGEAHDLALAGDTAFLETQRIFLERHGFLEECFFTFSFSPIREEAGVVGGLFHPVIEMTTKMLGERRTRALRDLAARTSVAKTVVEALELSAQTLAEHDLDLPFALLYLVDASGQQVRLVGTAGVNSDTCVAPTTPEWEPTSQSVWPMQLVLASGLAVQIDDVGTRMHAVSCGPYAESPSTALILPIVLPGAKRPTAVLVAGVSSRLPLTDGYRNFYDLIAAAVTTAVANAEAHEEQRQRAESLAELDRAKTAFFSNISHEFRTPLTLILGPIEDLLAHSDIELTATAAGQLEVVKRNGKRLLRLVNSLLEFSTIEAGRARASYQATDLSALTTELAGVFRAAVERAGMKLTVDCAPLHQPVFVDRDMWEKVVLNLLSNAFKFTFEGEITVSLRLSGDHVELVVRDTGTGVPPAEMPRLFERFHRVENAKGRTHEGSGIGLALVQELLRLHGGSISADSIFGMGTTFTARVPLGSAHLPADQIRQSSTTIEIGAWVTPFAEEALRWLPRDDALRLTASEGAEARPNARLTPERNSVDDRPLVLVADDNADMRQYVVRILEELFRVEAVQDGASALEAVRKQQPDLILTDVMMPRVDGFGLLQALRSDPRTCGVPVIMLSARAGEDSRVEGMKAGADDYLVKPFSARELLARVSAHVQMARLRREASDSLREGDERLRMALIAARMVAWRYDSSSGSYAASDNADDVFGLASGADLDHIEQRFALVHPDDAVQYRDTVEKAVADSSSYVSQFRTTRSDNGGVIWLEERGHAIAREPGEPVRLVGVVMDITERKVGEEERDLLVARLGEQDERKDEFLATLAHELRNPLAPLSNGLQLLNLMPDANSAVARTRAMMERQLSLMVRLVDDLMDVSRITRGKVELHRSMIDLAQVVRQAVETSRPLIDGSRHELTVIAPSDEVLVHGDMTRLAQVLSNLLNNAAKYSEPGGQITIDYARHENDVRLRVSDTGVGIAPHMLPIVFDLFTQSDRSLSKAQGGLGIGLSLVRKLVELHGGRVEAHSAGIGQGSLFTVWLPAVEPSDAVAETAPTADAATGSVPPSGRRILIADDNLDAAASLSLLLEMMGHEVETVHDGTRALTAAEAFVPNLILLDIGMPLMDGYAACRQIRARSWGREVPVVALSGWGQADDRQRSAAAGFNEHLVKPVDKDSLLRVLARYL